MRTSVIFAFFSTCLIGYTFSQLTFNNPIFDRNSADPSVMRLGDFYYLTLSENTETELTIFKSPILTSFREAERHIACVAPEGYANLWASEMHMVNGQLYIYFTMSGNGKDHRMYVIKADDPTEPMGNWSDPIRLMPDWDLAAIDGTVFQHGNGQLYFVWATWAFGPLTLYIAHMTDAITVDTTDVKQLRPTPHSAWECSHGCTNEGAYFIYNRDVSYMIFSGSSTWGPDYSLGMMSITYDKDPMVQGNWASYIGPVFSRNDAEDVYTTGHAAFTVSPDGSETWMVYHATVNTTHIEGFRIARIEKIEWNLDGSPRFPIAHGYNTPQPVPSGQTYV